MNKYGSYVQKLMTTILDPVQEEFVTNLSWYELNKINEGIGEFLREHRPDDSVARMKTENKITQEKDNGKNRE